MVSTFSNLSVINNWGTRNSSPHKCRFFRAELLGSMMVSVSGKMIGFIFSFLPLHLVKLSAQEKVIIVQNQTVENNSHNVTNIQTVDQKEKEFTKELVKENDWKNDWKIVGLLVVFAIVCIAVVVIFVVFKHDKQKGFDLIMKMLDVVIAFFTRK